MAFEPNSASNICIYKCSGSKLKTFLNKFVNKIKNILDLHGSVRFAVIKYMAFKCASTLIVSTSDKIVKYS